MKFDDLLPVNRFIATLEVVEREGVHLAYSWQTLFGDGQKIDAEWVIGLERNPEEAVRLEAFVSRYGRMQDTLADKLLPRWLMALAERPGSQIETLNRAERLGVIESVEAWLAARKLRNQLVHEYMQDPVAFAEALNVAMSTSVMVLETYNHLQRYAENTMNLSNLPKPLRLPTDTEK
ncbi:hypothetical protein [Halomonas llamarensis]|uniref:Uncharacterized protein n=1 Tax=Halomonas llamarensis TaxID=2945104 RepID=A0ABT0SPP1_9GAMM|nr:hypothetical protein [Halomonas llamarensis]MCL7929747.1 hypothetical protein [Halomonas llamarensis]